MRDPKERLRHILFDIAWEAASRDALALKPSIERLLKRLEELGYGG